MTRRVCCPTPSRLCYEQVVLKTRRRLQDIISALLECDNDVEATIRRLDELSLAAAARAEAQSSLPPVADLPVDGANGPRAYVAACVAALQMSPSTGHTHVPPRRPSDAVSFAGAGVAEAPTEAPASSAAAPFNDGENSAAVDEWVDVVVRVRVSVAGLDAARGCPLPGLTRARSFVHVLSRRWPRPRT